MAGFAFPGDNFAIRAEVLNRLNALDPYRKLFGEVFAEVKNGAPIDFDMFGKAIAEFEFSLVLANAPIDQYARGQKKALTIDQKKGALIFFDRAGCVECHKVSGPSNEMFSAKPKNLRKLVPKSVPSGRPVLIFEFHEFQ